MVHSLFAASDDWDDQLEGFEAGWPGFLEVLRLYLLHFAGQPAVPAGLSSVCAGGEAEAWRRLNRGLGLAGADVGARVRAPEGAPPLSGVVVRIQQTHQRRELHLLLDQPGPGVALVASHVQAGQARGTVEAYFYGEHAGAVAQRHRELMQPWLARTLG
jgi:hypothetical protein